jgi:hypothetical protein
MDIPMGGATYPRKAFFLDPTTGKLTPARDALWPLDAKHFFFYSVAASGAITVTGGGPPGDLGWPKSDCEATFDPASGAWTDTKRCKDIPADVLRYPAANGAPGVAGWGGGMKAYRNGAWETVMTTPHKTTGASLDEGLTLDAHHAVAADTDTYEVVSCTF